MKKLPFYLPFVLFFLYSCKKSNSGGGTPPTPYYLSSAVALSPQQRIVDSFHYDTLNRIDTFTQSIYDTTSGSPMFNTWMVQFAYQGADTRPSWYNYYDQPLGGYGDYHLLSYDTDDRIAKDTSLSGSGYVTYFSYPNNNIAATTFYEGTPDNNLIDTLYVGSGNIDREAVYFSDIPGQPDVQEANVHFTDASTANPAYHAAISNSIGPLLFNLTFNGNGDFVDFISKNAFNGAAGINYTLSTDSKGRLAKMAASVGGTSGTIVFTYY
ncbi:MAG TPA: hypothetical protein VFE32_09800 [Puia sp.]|jgi:hypothetical protein|nr:hypothetical protein [Puia sp.]